MRVYDIDGRILISADHFEEGERPGAMFLPDPAEIARTGIIRHSPTGDAVSAYLPVSVPEPAILEVELSVAATMAAMTRGARLGMGLMAASLLAVGIVLVTMLEREVVAPLRRVDVLLREHRRPDSANGSGDELSELEQSVSELLEEGRGLERRVAEEEHRMAAREGLAEVGQLAAEMAHEFKRPLASIRTAVSMLEQEYELDEGGRQVLGAVNGQLEHLHETMQDLFSLAKPLVLEGEPVEVADLLDEAIAELAGLPGSERVEVHRTYAYDGLAVQGDARRLRQALSNIMANGVEAMPEGGHLNVAVLPAEPGFVEISIQDTGNGLAPAEVERALRPFYSTKPLGTGLGLPLVARIIAAHRGGLAIESRPHVGTKVRITLPALMPSATGTGGGHG